MTRKIEIYTWQDTNAPLQYAWCAAYQEYDLDVEAASAATEQDAIIDLVTNYDLPKGRVK
jgi:hypothetical protein